MVIITSILVIIIKIKVIITLSCNDIYEGVDMDYYSEIKEKFINHEIYKKVKDYSKNRHELQTYYDVGMLLVKAQGGASRAKYGNKLIKEYAVKLTNELGIGYTPTSLKRMRQLYLLVEKR